MVIKNRRVGQHTQKKSKHNHKRKHHSTSLIIACLQLRIQHTLDMIQRFEHIQKYTSDAFITNPDINQLKSTANLLIQLLDMAESMASKSTIRHAQYITYKKVGKDYKQLWTCDVTRWMQSVIDKQE
jgi:hypothetical protein